MLRDDVIAEIDKIRDALLMLPEDADIVEVCPEILMTHQQHRIQFQDHELHRIFGVVGLTKDADDNRVKTTLGECVAFAVM